MVIEANSSTRPEVGAIITRPKGFLVSHSAIYMGQDVIFDNVPAGARFARWSDFSLGNPVTVGAKINLPEHELWRRAHAIIAAKRKYHLVDFNCDDALNLLAGSVVRPSQAIGIAIFGLFVIAAVGLVSSKA